jgi:L-ribulose-5-phosphate 4-epimerase
MNYEQERKKIIETALLMKKNGLIRMSGGNVSVRLSEDRIMVTPTAMDYETMELSDLVIVDNDGNIIEGSRRPTSDLKAILYIFNHMKDINVLIHTHQPSAVALSLVSDELPCISTTMVDELHGPVNVAPFTISSDEGMGIATIEHANGSLAVILKHHGVMAFGKDFDQALCAAIYLEESCDVYLKALSTGRQIPVLSKEQIEAEDAPRGYYGQ